MCCVIQNIDDVFKSINDALANKGKSTINLKDWSAYLSGSSSNNVRKFWIDQLRQGKCISRDKAITLLSSLNAVLKQLNLPLLSSETDITCK